jgi:hypothetical protein
LAPWGLLTSAPFPAPSTSVLTSSNTSWRAWFEFRHQQQQQQVAVVMVQVAVAVAAIISS